ncbi:MAG: hypothetical protein LBP40_06215 [Campylobacteraceae bacterium]|nr:hypothetical protein [Campylobacteraceae bacterium]
MQNEIKKFTLISSGGILLMLFGIFLLYIKARYDADAPCLTKSDFYSINSRNIPIFIAFGVIFIGIITELLGRFKLACAANDIKIFYNRLNLYFAAILFILISLKIVMASSETLFFMKMCVSRIYCESESCYSVKFAKSWAVPFFLILFVYVFLKDSIYFSRVFKSVLHIVTFTLGIISIMLFLSAPFLSFFRPYGLYKFREFFGNFTNIVLFVPFLVVQLITYMKISKTPNKAKEFSLINIFYDIIFQKKIVMLIFCIAVLVITLYFSAFSLEQGYILLLLVPFTASITVIFLPLLFFPLNIKKRTLIIFSFLASLLILLNMIFMYFLLFFDVMALPVLLMFCIIFKLQQYNFTKTSILLIAITCVLFRYFVFPY